MPAVPGSALNCFEILASEPAVPRRLPRRHDLTAALARRARARRELEHVHAAVAVRGVDVALVQVGGPDDRVVGPPVGELGRVRRIRDVQEPGALAVPRVRHDRPIDVEVVGRAEVRVRVVRSADRPRALLARRAPLAHDVEPERVGRRRPPGLAVVAALERRDRELAAVRARLGGGPEVLLGGQQQIAATVAAVAPRSGLADRPPRVVLEAAGRVAGDGRREPAAAVRDRIQRRRLAVALLDRIPVPALGPVAASAAVAGDPGDAHGVDLDVVRVGGRAVTAEQVDRVHRVATRVARVAQVGDDDRTAERPVARRARLRRGGRRAAGPQPLAVVDAGGGVAGRELLEAQDPEVLRVLRVDDVDARDVGRAVRVRLARLTGGRAGVGARIA